VINGGDLYAKVFVLIRSVLLGMGEDSWKVLVVQEPERTVSFTQVSVAHRLTVPYI
jgi:hypothetical protein